VRIRQLAGLAGVLGLAGGLGLPVIPAAAYTPDTLVVSGGSSWCHDTPGSNPFCTIGAAAREAQPGQTIVVFATDNGYHETVNLTRSGTPDKPITFVSKPLPSESREPAAKVYGAANGPAFTVIGAHDIVVKDFSVVGDGSAFDIRDSSAVRIEHTTAGQTAAAYDPTIVLSGATTDVTLARNVVQGSKVDSVRVSAGVKNTVITGNEISAGKGPQLAATDAPGTVVTGNTLLQGCGTVLQLAGASTNSAVRNNIVATTDAACTGDKPVVSVSEASATGTTLDHNLVHPAGADGMPYNWAGKAARTPADLGAASGGQGLHDLVADPQLTGDGNAAHGLAKTSPAVDSADADAPGVLTTDLNGNPVTDDPEVADSGAGSAPRDRGAYELQSIGGLKVSFTGAPAPYPAKVTATASLQQNWDGPVTYSFNFGDGSAPLVSTQPVVEHVYTTDAWGDRLSVTATGPDGRSYSAQAADLVKINKPGAPTVSFNLAPCTSAETGACRHPLTYVVDVSGSRSPWPITGYTVDYGDGTPVSTDPNAPHTYRVAGEYTMTVTVKDAGGQTAKASNKVYAQPRAGQFNGYSPVRVADTRKASPTGRLAAGGSFSIRVGDGAIPGGLATSAVVLNVTAVSPGGSGWLAVGPGVQGLPNTSNINYTAGQVVPNLVTVPVGSDGTVTVWNMPGGPAVDVVVDALGAYDPDHGDRYTNLAQPVRVMDTRYGTGTPAGKISSVCDGSSADTKLKIAGVNGVPANAGSVLLNVTVTEPERDGFLTVGHSKTTSNLNFKANQTVANQVIAPLDADGTVTVCNSGGRVHVVMDVFGYYAPDGLSQFQPVPPQRLVDTRSAVWRNTPLGPGATEFVDAPEAGSHDSGAVAAVLNVTAITPDAPGYLTVWAGNSTRPGTSNVNFTPGQIVANHVTTGISDPTGFAFYNSAGHTHVAADLFGYFFREMQ